MSSSKLQTGSKIFNQVCVSMMEERSQFFALIKSLFNFLDALGGSPRRFVSSRLRSAASRFPYCWRANCDGVIAFATGAVGSPTIPKAAGSDRTRIGLDSPPTDLAVMWRAALAGRTGWPRAKCPAGRPAPVAARRALRRI